VGFSSCSCNREPYDDAVRLGQEALGNGDYENAIYHLKRASKLSPEDYTILINLGMAYFNAEEYSSAANVYEKAVLINPSEEALETLAVTRYKQKYYEDALNVYNRAITEYGRKSHLIAGIAACQARQGNAKYAVDLLQEALTNKPNDPVVLYNLATLKADNNEFVDAARFYVLFFDVVDADINKQQLNQARERFAVIAKKYPTNEKAEANKCYTNAVNYYKQQNLVGAFTEARKASSLDPTEPNYVALLIAISKKVNRPQNIQRLTTRIKNGFPDFAEKYNIK
jgi:Flp pilus assembly protein TadD